MDLTNLRRISANVASTHIATICYMAPIMQRHLAIVCIFIYKCLLGSIPNVSSVSAGVRVHSPHSVPSGQNGQAHPQRGSPFSSK